MTGGYTAAEIQLSGRALRLQAAEQTFTGTEVLQVPAVVAQFADRQSNFKRYQARVSHQWAQTWFGTLRLPLVVIVAGYPDPVREQVPPRVREMTQRYWRCDGCAQLYWRGTHWRDMRARIKVLCPETVFEDAD